LGGVFSILFKPSSRSRAVSLALRRSVGVFVMTVDPWQVVNAQHLKIPGVGYCIYCGPKTAGERLGGEHIMPFSLGGTAEILEASCRACEDITKKLDGYLANSIYREFRIFHRLQSRRKTTTKTKTLPATFRMPGGPERTMDLPVEDCPTYVHLPLLAQPGIIRGDEPEVAFTHYGIRTYAHYPDTFWQAAGLPEDAIIEVKQEGEVRLPIFARALAKIAYCHFFAQYAKHSPEAPSIVELIKAQYPHPSYLVGGILGGDIPPENKANHRIGILPVQVGERVFLVCLIRLFAFAGNTHAGTGMPVYQVVMGEITGQRLSINPARPEELAQRVAKNAFGVQ
jgi:hypothetical protein